MESLSDCVKCNPNNCCAALMFLVVTGAFWDFLEQDDIPVNKATDKKRYKDFHDFNINPQYSIFMNDELK